MSSNCKQDDSKILDNMHLFLTDSLYTPNTPLETPPETNKLNEFNITSSSYSLYNISEIQNTTCVVAFLVKKLKVQNCANYKQN